MSTGANRVAVYGHLDEMWQCGDAQNIADHRNIVVADEQPLQGMGKWELRERHGAWRMIFVECTVRKASAVGPISWHRGSECPQAGLSRGGCGALVITRGGLRVCVAAAMVYGRYFVPADVELDKAGEVSEVREARDGIGGRVDDAQGGELREGFQ